MLPREIVGLIAGDGFRRDHPAAAGAATDAEYGGLRVRVLSAPKARSYSPGTHEIAISIRDRNEADVPLSSRFVSVLRLVFNDTGQFANHASAGLDATDAFSAAHAQAVVACLRAHDDAKVLMIHCAAGISRSRSLAAAVCVSLDLPYSFHVVNDDVYCAMIRAFEQVG